MRLKTKVFFALLFSVLVFLGSQINFSPVVGAENQFFTLFQFFGPIAGGFLGPLFGGISVLVAELMNFFLAGKAFNAVNFLRLAPMLFAAYYFATHRKKLDKLGVGIPLIAMAAFILHPVGGTVWFYSLYWLIPVIARFFPKRLFLRSLGATFTAHAVGGALWIWTVPMPAEAWVLLIPIVAVERVLFALGISVSFIGFNTLLHRVERFLPEKIISVDKNYVLSRNLFRLRA